MPFKNNSNRKITIYISRYCFLFYAYGNKHTLSNAQTLIPIDARKKKKYNSNIKKKKKN
jgi:hypothetical protein